MRELARPTQPGSLTYRQLRDQADQVRAIPLAAVLRQSGAQPDRYDPAKWHTAQGVLSVTGAKFMNWNHAQGGGGAIDLVMHLHQLGFREAVQWLGHHFPGSLARPPAPVSLKGALHLPLSDPTRLGSVRRYLVAERHLPGDLVDMLIPSGTLYADPRANAVFLMRGPHHHPVGAELRGTTARPWHGLAPGSQRDLGYFAVHTTEYSAVILVESAIDALSCSVLHPQYRCLSTAGARPNPGWLGTLLDECHRVYCGFDADPTGENMARAMIARHPNIRRLRPAQHDWNDVLKARR
jgi:hypothetical protein